MLRIQRSVTVVLAVGLLALSLWSKWQHDAMAANARSAASNLAECRRLTARIVSLRRQPTRASGAANSSADLIRQLEEAATLAGVDPGVIVRIDPQLPRRVKNTEYEEQSTAVELELVTMKEMVSLLISLGQMDVGLDTGSLRLVAATDAIHALEEEVPSDLCPEMWNVHLMLTRLIFSPKRPSGNF